MNIFEISKNVLSRAKFLDFYFKIQFFFKFIILIQSKNSKFRWYDVLWNLHVVAKIILFCKQKKSVCQFWFVVRPLICSILIDGLQSKIVIKLTRSLYYKTFLRSFLWQDCRKVSISFIKHLRYFFPAKIGVNYNRIWRWIF